MPRHESQTVKNAIVMYGERTDKEEMRIREALTQSLSDEWHTARVGFMGKRHYPARLPNSGTVHKWITGFKGFARSNGSIDSCTMTVGEGLAGLAPLLYGNLRFKNGNNRTNVVYCPEMMILANPAIPESAIDNSDDREGQYRLTENYKEELALVGFIKNRTIVIAEAPENYSNSDSLLSPGQIAECMGVKFVQLAEGHDLLQAIGCEIDTFLGQLRPVRPSVMQDDRTFFADS